MSATESLLTTEALLTVAEVARLLGVRQRRVRTFIRNRRIPYVTVPASNGESVPLIRFHAKRLQEALVAGELTQDIQDQAKEILAYIAEIQARALAR